MCEGSWESWKGEGRTETGPGRRAEGKNGVKDGRAKG